MNILSASPTQRDGGFHNEAETGLPRWDDFPPRSNEGGGTKQSIDPASLQRSVSLTNLQVDPSDSELNQMSQTPDSAYGSLASLDEGRQTAEGAAPERAPFSFPLQRSSSLPDIGKIVQPDTISKLSTSPDSAYGSSESLSNGEQNSENLEKEPQDEAPEMSKDKREKLDTLVVPLRRSASAPHLTTEKKEDEERGPANLIDPRDLWMELPFARENPDSSSPPTQKNLWKHIPFYREESIPLESTFPDLNADNGFSAAASNMTSPMTWIASSGDALLAMTTEGDSRNEAEGETKPLPVIASDDQERGNPQDIVTRTEAVIFFPPLGQSNPTPEVTWQTSQESIVPSKHLGTAVTSDPILLFAITQETGPLTPEMVQMIPPLTTESADEFLTPDTSPLIRENILTKQSTEISEDLWWEEFKPSPPSLMSTIWEDEDEDLEQLFGEFDTLHSKTEEKWAEKNDPWATDQDEWSFEPFNELRQRSFYLSRLPTIWEDSDLQKDKNFWQITWVEDETEDDSNWEWDYRLVTKAETVSSDPWATDQDEWSFPVPPVARKRLHPKNDIFENKRRKMDLPKTFETEWIASSPSASRNDEKKEEARGEGGPAQAFFTFLSDSPDFLVPLNQKNLWEDLPFYEEDNIPFGGSTTPVQRTPSDSPSSLRGAAGDAAIHKAEENLEQEGVQSLPPSPLPTIGKEDACLVLDTTAAHTSFHNSNVPPKTLWSKEFFQRFKGAEPDEKKRMLRKEFYPHYGLHLNNSTPSIGAFPQNEDTTTSPEKAPERTVSKETSRQELEVTYTKPESGGLEPETRSNVGQPTASQMDETRGKTQNTNSGTRKTTTPNPFSFNNRKPVDHRNKMSPRQEEHANSVRQLRGFPLIGGRSAASNPSDDPPRRRRS